LVAQSCTLWTAKARSEGGKNAALVISS
jgi:hypothetical protein